VPAGVVEGAAIVEGLTVVPAAERDSPTAATPGAAAEGPMVPGLGGAALVPGAPATAVAAGAVPEGVDGADEVAAAGVPDGVRMSDAPVLVLVVADAEEDAPGLDRVKLLEPRPLPV
jgi:hypothetical protein